jgi:hypothetical protein
MMRTLVVILALWMSAQTGHEEMVTLYGPTGNDLLKRCGDIGHFDNRIGTTASPTELIATAKNVGICAGFIAGVLDTIEDYSSIKAIHKPYCLPPQVEFEQLEKVVMKNLQDNPARLHEPGEIRVIDAMANAFPCK